MNIIRHSDDLGVTHQSTKQILAAWRAGDLDGFSIFANGEATELISAELANAPEKPARIAVHFNLTEGYSTLPHSMVPLLVNSSGKFKHSFVSLLMSLLFTTVNMRRKLLAQIGIECDAQIRRVQAICGTRSPTIIDGHAHIQMIPGIFTTTAKCALKAGIHNIRVSKEPFHVANSKNDWRQLFWWVNLCKHLLLRLFSVPARHKMQSLGLHSPDVIIGVLYSGKMSATRALSGVKAATMASEIEVIFHIGRAHADEASRWRNANEAAFHLSEWRDIERTELSLFTNQMNNSQGC